MIIMVMCWLSTAMIMVMCRVGTDTTIWLCAEEVQACRGMRDRQTDKQNVNLWGT